MIKNPPLSLTDLPSFLGNALPSLPKLRGSLADLTRARRSLGGMLPGMTDLAGTGALSEVGEFGYNPGRLRAFRYAPPDLPPGAPLVVVLHGCTQTAGGFDRGAGWSALAKQHRFAVLFPEQQRQNNAHLCFNWFESSDVARGHGEVASIRAAVAAAMTELRSDPRRVFVTGLSAGGAMTAAMLATYPDTFAAGAIIAGLPYGRAGNVGEALAQMYHPDPRPAAELGDAVRAACPGARRWPTVSIWHGDADTTVVPANAGELSKQWCDVHGLDEAQARTGVVDGALRRAWHDASGVLRVEAFTVPGLSHGVPIKPGAAGDAGVGEAMPYFLPSNIASTLCIAQRWGLTSSR